MDFDAQKKKQLSKVDLSKKGAVDKQIVHIIKRLNEKRDFYTTSSCAGRIVLLSIAEDGRKDHSTWLLAEHDPVAFEQIKKVLTDAAIEEAHKIWLKQEAAIFHICARDLDSAEKLINAAKESGLKRTGAIGLKKRVVLEIIGTENINALVALDGKNVISDDYLNLILEEANKNMAKNRKHLERFYTEIEKIT